MKPKFGLGVFVCLFNQDISKIMLIKRNLEKRKKWGADWGNIGGKIELKESSIQACLREAKEEIGLILRPKQLKLLQVKESPCFTPKIHAVHFAYGAVISEKAKIILNDESEEYRWFDLEKIPKKTLDSKKELLRFARLMRKQKSR